MNILSNLNPKQKQAVTSTRGPVLVIAGPGSGKTFCLTSRVAYLIQQDIPAKNILAVTFTNKAAEEMKERINKLIGNKAPSGNLSAKLGLPTIGTFHAICLQILRREIDKLILENRQKIYQKNFIIYDQVDQLSLIKRILKELEINPEQFKPRTVQETISRAKDELIDVRTYQKQAQEYFPQTIAEIYLAYQAALRKANALDFDDLIMLTVQLFQKNLAILEKYQEKWKYILVDEYQDINTSQYTLTNLLSKKHNNLFVIGDDAQGIYSWRGADFRNILNFEKDYPEAKVILLEQNYRSTPNILEASYHIISKNTQGKEKKLWTKNPQGPLINIIETDDEEEEGSFLIEEMESLIRQKGLALKDFTVLYRTNAQSRAIEEAFLKANFPYKIVGTVRFYERKEIKDILAYLKFIANPKDLISLQRIVNLPPRRLAKYTKNIQEIYLSKEHPEPLKKFYQLIDDFRQANQKMPLTKLINLIIKKIDYEKYIRDGQEEGERRWENIQELFSVTSKHEQSPSGLDLEKFLEEISLLSNHDEVETNKNLVNLMTLHCAKGLEFPIVFIVGCEEGVFPHSKSFLDPEQMEEERRLCYVGITRAKQKAYLSFVRQRRLWGQIMSNSPSRFLSDIPNHLVELREHF